MHPKKRENPFILWPPKYSRYDMVEFNILTQLDIPPNNYKDKSYIH